MKAELTDKLARSIEPVPGKILRVFDQAKAAPRGFLLRITPNGARVWAMRYRLDTGKERELSIGDVLSWPLGDARKRGHALRREIDAGVDPLGERQAKRAAADAVAAEPTVDDLIARYIAEKHPALAATTQEENRSMLRRYVSPAFGKLRLAEVRRTDVEALHRKITAAGYQRRANAVLVLTRVLFNCAIGWELVAANPTKGITRNPEHNRERYLSAAETDRLIEQLDRRRASRRDSCDVIQLALLTGARRGELVAMKWADVDLDAGTWTKPASTTKHRKLHRVPLSADVIALLRQRLTEDTGDGKVVALHGSGFVFKGGGSKNHMRTLERDFEVIRAAIGCDDLHFHDLRHSHASLLVNAGLSLPVIGAMLGHARPQTTARYAHLADEPLRAAAEIVAAKLRK
jgi:integrase